MAAQEQVWPAALQLWGCHQHTDMPEDWHKSSFPFHNQEYFGGKHLGSTDMYESELQIKY